MDREFRLRQLFEHALHNILTKIDAYPRDVPKALELADMRIEKMRNQYNLWGISDNDINFLLQAILLVYLTSDKMDDGVSGGASW